MIGENFTAVVFARNESGRLPFVLENLAHLKNVLVVDNFSTDDTRAVAEKWGRPSIQVFNVGGFVETPSVMDNVWPHVSTDYLAICFCAELIAPSLLQLYDRVSLAKSYEVVRADRISITAGLPIPIDMPPFGLRWRYPGEIRFIKRGAVNYHGNQVHGRGSVVADSDKVLRAPSDEENAIYQFRDYDSSESEIKHCIYNDEIGAQKFHAHEKRSLWKVLVRALAVFFIRYFVYGGWRYGGIGFIHCYYRLHMELGIGFRLYEFNKAVRKDQVKAMHDNLKRNMLKEWCF